MSANGQIYKIDKGKEPMGDGSKQMTPRGIEIPFEVVQSYVDNELLSQLDELNRKYSELLREDERRSRAYMKMGADLFDVKKENEELLKEIEELKKDNPTKDNFIHTVDCRNFLNDSKEMASKEWVVSFWDNMYELASQTDNNGNYIIKCAAELAPIYKVINESTSLAYKFEGTLREFEYHWNSNVVERLQDSKHAKKLTCKYKTLGDALNQPWWKNISPTSWYNLSLEGGRNVDKYDKAYLFKKSIEAFRL